MSRIFLIHRDDALNAAWTAFLAGIPMSWLPLDDRHEVGLTKSGHVVALARRSEVPHG